VSFWIAQRETADLLRRRHVRFDERGRQPKRTGNVVEAGRRVVRRQVLARIDLQLEQIPDDVRILSAVEAVQSRWRCERRCGAIEVAFERRNHRLESLRVRTLHAERRHLTGACLAHDQFPLLPILVHVGRVERVHCQTARGIETRGLHLLAVAADTVLVEKRTLLVGRDGWRGSGGHRGHGLRLGRARSWACGSRLLRLRRRRCRRLRACGLGVQRTHIDRCCQAANHQRSSCHHLLRELEPEESWGTAVWEAGRSGLKSQQTK
jgi:hypothetical protein